MRKTPSGLLVPDNYMPEQEKPKPRETPEKMMRDIDDHLSRQVNRYFKFIDTNHNKEEQSAELIRLNNLWKEWLIKDSPEKVKAFGNLFIERLDALIEMDNKLHRELLEESDPQKDVGE